MVTLLQLFKIIEKLEPVYSQSQLMGKVFLPENRRLFFKDSSTEL